ncbi:tRNA adenosine(34) deaminase TadA [Moraxella sp.]|uniref:tRNA adenosine(34) deaminase TadA n=1 Tax=Moraxella sp. TaxID=479 RepID=UPI0026DAA820|nr:tRNA adenosine(34) deaminase TadA [Moraxella sp.]MDO4894490.1 tRNA adenosine(34) deaminase TadA [Moraxella sp.]
MSSFINTSKNNHLKNPSQVIIKPGDAFDEQDHDFMNIALDLAKQGARSGEVPVGAVLVYDNQIIAQGFNCPISTCDATAHAEMVAIRRACESLDNYRLMGATLYVTLEPCTMCLGAIVHSRINRVVFGASEPKSGVVISQEKLNEKSYFNHSLLVEGGLFAEQSKALLQAFFKERRKSKKSIGKQNSL